VLEQHMQKDQDKLGWQAFDSTFDKIMSFQMQKQIQQFCSMTNGTLQSIRLKAVVKQSCSKPSNPIRAQINVKMWHVIIWSSC